MRWLNSTTNTLNSELWELSQKENLPTNLHLFIWVIWNIKSKKWGRHLKVFKNVKMEEENEYIINGS